MKRPLYRLAFGALFIPAALGCAGRTVDDADSEDPSCEVVLGLRLVRHTCSHTENGPYAEIAAQASTGAAADVSQLHKPFDVTAVSVPFVLTYRASREGTHVIFTDKPVEWGVSDSKGSAIEVQANVSAPSNSDDSCTGTTHASLLRLQHGESYMFTGSSTAKRFILFVEHAETFGEDAFVTECPEGT